MAPERRRIVNYGETDLPERKNRRAAMAKGTIRIGDAGYWVKRGVTKLCQNAKDAIARADVPGASPS